MAAWGTAASAEGCRLALVLALDISSSVDAAEDRLQREGLAGALRQPEVVRAFLKGELLALYVFEWSGLRSHVPITDGWELVEDEADLRRIAATVASSPRSRTNLPTAVGAALGHAAGRLRDGPDCRAWTVDLSGDGIHNERFSPALAFREFPFEGVTVNALIVGGTANDAELVAWFQAEVLRGPGAFSVCAEGHENYARAMEAKLRRELELPLVGKTPRPRAVSRCSGSGRTSNAPSA